MSSGDRERERAAQRFIRQQEEQKRRREARGGSELPSPPREEDRELAAVRAAIERVAMARAPAPVSPVSPEMREQIMRALALTAERAAVGIAHTIEQKSREQFFDVTITMDGSMDNRFPDVDYRGQTPMIRMTSREEDLEQTLMEVTDKLRQQGDFLKKLSEEPTTYAVVLAAAAGKLVIRRGSEILEVNGSPGVVAGPGAVVRLLTKTMNMVSVVETPPAMGEIVSVTRVVGDAFEVPHGAGTRLVLAGRSGAKEGDRVVLDPTSSVALKNLGPEPPAQAFAGDTGVSWDDIGGQEEAKLALREALEGPVKHAEIYARYGKKRCKGALLFGPPGNGKTMLGKAAATALASLHGASAARSGYQYVKGPELLNMFVGASEQNVRRLFESARRHMAEHGYPAVIFIDEAEALLSKRGIVGGGVLTSTIVPMFLAEMDGVLDSGAFVLLATNRPDVLDPAIVREGRIDRKIRVGRPDVDAARAVFERHLTGRPIFGDVGELAAGAVAELYDAKHALYRVHLSDGPPKTVRLHHVTSGAQIAGVVDAAAQIAIRRELAGGPSEGLQAEDIRDAISSTLAEQRHLEHADELRDFVEPFKANFRSVERIRG